MFLLAGFLPPFSLVLTLLDEDLAKQGRLVIFSKLFLPLLLEFPAALFLELFGEIW